MICEACDDKYLCVDFLCFQCNTVFCELCVQNCVICGFDFCKKDFHTHQCETEKLIHFVICQKCKIPFEKTAYPETICSVCQFFATFSNVKKNKNS